MEYLGVESEIVEKLSSTKMKDRLECDACL